MKTNQNLMELVSTHGTGDDIRTLANLFRNAGENNVPYTPLAKLTHEEDANIYQCIGFDPNHVIGKLANIERNNPHFRMATQFMEAALQDQELTEQMAMLFVLVSKALPMQMLGLALGGRPDIK